MLPEIDRSRCRYCGGSGWQAVVFRDERGTDMQRVRLCYCNAAPLSVTLGSEREPVVMHRPERPLKEPEYERRPGTDLWERS